MTLIYPFNLLIAVTKSNNQSPPAWGRQNFTKMKTIEVNALKEHKNLEEIFIANKMDPFIPSNSILFKNITGIGATTLELQCRRNSIIVEPNSPVIVGKQKKFPKMLGVKYNVGRTDVIKYLKNETIEFKKIVVTPESFHKVMQACKILKIDVYKEFFFLFDECEKVNKDIKFRPKIILPMEDFFKFENKAFVSATPIIPSDPRFELHKFQIYNVIPDYDISHTITRYDSNNSIQTLINLLKNDDSEKRHFIFLTSVDAITTIIKFMKNHSSCSIFCSETSAVTLKTNKYAHVGTSIDESKFSKFNFLTGRFFSAVDIDLEEDVSIYIVSDVNVSLNSLLDPHTDVIQIIGRFRNSNFGKKTHIISTTKEEVPYMTKDEIKTYLLILKGVYDTIFKILETVTDIDSKKILDELQKVLNFRCFMMHNGTVNYYMVDNFYYDNRVISYYSSPYIIAKQYEESALLNSEIKRFNIVNSITESHSRGSDSLYIFGETRSYTEIMDEIIDQLIEAEFEVQTDIPNKKLSHIKAKYQSVFPELIEAYELVGAQVLLTECHSKAKVNRLIQKTKETQQGVGLSFIHELKKVISINTFASGEKLTKQFSDLLKKHKIDKVPPTIHGLKKYVSLSKRTKKNNVQGYYVEKHLI